MRKSIIVLAIVTGVMSLWNWFSCHDFLDLFNLIAQNVSLQVNDYIHTDVSLPLLIVRIFHNKASGFLYEFMRHFIHYWDATFLIHFLSFIGWLGLWAGIYYIFKKVRGYKGMYVIVLLLVITQLIELILRPHSLFLPIIVVLWVLYQSIAMYGLWHFLGTKEDNKTRVIVYLFLLGVSVWWFLVFRHDIYNYCAKI